MLNETLVKATQMAKEIKSAESVLEKLKKASRIEAGNVGGPQYSSFIDGTVLTMYNEGREETPFVKACNKIAEKALKQWIKEAEKELKRRKDEFAAL